jgi:hypothetical protein
MTQLSKNLMCIVIRGGIEKWVEKEKSDTLSSALKRKDCPQFIEYEGEMINRADITGIFSADTMQEKTRQKNGQWKCQYGEWHDKFEKCTDECKINSLLNKSL